ncbi:prenyltransferase/squalene oxidase repeat-containing protein [Streptomyces sp. NPDC089919]|uniref:prenyltransferase/squalene oxidase repeat-containing protein n=1 Tax=Streptomyces sp. NPDC089919 TaxID=3155188 RepID=UPI0034285DAC
MKTEQQANRHRSAGRRLLGLGAALALTCGAAVAFLAPATPASADPLTKCTATVGAVVAVDFGPFGGKVVRGCDTTPTTGYELLHEAGFTTAGTVHDGPAFICRIGTASFNSGKQYPTPDKEACELTPPASAYWSYWIASPGQKKWTYSPLGAMSRTPKPGDVDAWVYGGTDIGGSKGRPTFSPDDVRAGGGSKPRPTDPAKPGIPYGAVDMAAATRWVTGQLKDGERVVDVTTGAPNHLLTAESVFALAAADRKSPTAAKAAAFLARPEQTDAFAYPAGKDQVPEPAAAARLALTAEAIGGDPHATGGHDLLGDLVKSVCPSGSDAPAPLPGCTVKGDFPTTSGQAEGQALAVIALVGGRLKPPADAVSRLTDFQCEDGGFTSMLIRPGDWCDSEAGATGLMVLALKRAGGYTAEVAKARAYLKKAQLADGGLPAASYGTVGSAYATGFAAQAMRALGDVDAADAAVSWLSKQQLTSGAFAFEAGGTDPLLYATVPATVAGARTDLFALTREEPAPTPTPTVPTTRPTAGPTTVPGAAPDPKKGSAYLVKSSRLIKGHYYESTPGTGFADFGLTIDGAYALAATGAEKTALRGIVDFLDRGGKDGAGRTINNWTNIGTKYAGGGSLGKTALLAEAVGRNPRKFAGKDLIAALAKAVCPAKSPAPDRSCAAKGAYTNATSVFSQSLGVIAQLRAGEKTAAARPIAYLKTLQQPSGAWVSLIGEPSKAEVDSTAMAAMALDLLKDKNSQAAVDKALAWLAKQQKTDGGFPGASGNSVNSAALAVQGLSLDKTKYQRQIAKARKFLASQQNKDGGFNIAKGGQRGSDLRASTQAVGGATGISFGTLKRSLTGTAAQPSTGASASPTASTSPRIVTPGENGGAGGAGGPLASTGAQVAGIGGAAMLLTVLGAAFVRTARTRIATGGAHR